MIKKQISVKWLLLLVFGIASVRGAFAAETVDCEARLATRSIARNILGVITTSLRNGGMTIAAVRVLAESESPVNPLAKMTPTSINTAARRALTTLVSNSLAQAMWPETRKLLNNLLKQHEHDDQKREDASHYTRKVLLPTPIGAPYRTSVYHTSVITLPDGVVAAAHFNDDKIEVTRLSDGEVIYSWSVPHCLTDREQNQRHLAWHRDRHGKLWLYFASQNDKTFYFQRMDPQDPQRPPVPIPNNLAEGYVASLKAYADDFIVVEYLDNSGAKYYNLSSGQLEDVTQAFLHPATTKYLLPRGANFFALKGSAAAPPVVYISHKSKKLLLEVNETEKILRVTNLSDPLAQPLKFTLPELDRLRIIGCYETNDDRIFFAVHQGGKEGQFFFYALDAGRNPIYVHKIFGLQTSTQWFPGRLGEPLLGYTTMWGGRVGLHVADPNLKSAPVSQYNLSSGQGDWSSYEDKTFFLTFANGKAQAIDLFGTP